MGFVFYDAYQFHDPIGRDNRIREKVAAIFIGERGDGKGLQYDFVWTLPDAMLTLMTLRLCRPFFSVVVKWSGRREEHSRTATEPECGEGKKFEQKLQTGSTLD